MPATGSTIYRYDCLFSNHHGNLVIETITAATGYCPLQWLQSKTISRAIVIFWLLNIYRCLLVSESPLVVYYQHAGQCFALTLKLLLYRIPIDTKTTLCLKSHFTQSFHHFDC